VLDLQQDLAVSGPSVIMANACASGANAIGHAADQILAGETD
jgi:3-oxoacyl-(acyl-carrier-protein) synthase